jgi:deoxyribodipyrimidine photo-lyase
MAQTAPPRILVYLMRRDLRLSDNPIFHAITTELASTNPSFTHLLPIYVFSARQIEISGLRALESPSSWPYAEARSRVGGYWRCGPHRARFLAESVWDLKQTMENVGSGLFIRAGHLGDEIKRVCEHVEKAGKGAKVVGVWMTAEVGSEELQEEEEVEKNIESFGGKLKLFTDEKYFVHE